jgi:tRNA 2-thiouridine synthesizing protein A
MTFVRTKLELEKLPSGEDLEILLSDGEPLKNVPHSAREMGFSLISETTVRPGIYRIVLRRTSG